MSYLVLPNMLFTILMRALADFGWGRESSIT